MTLVTVPALFATVALIVILAITILNILSFPHLGDAPPPRHTLSVSVLIPARDEAAVIGQTMQHLRNQDYPNYEVIVLDDRSTDGTAEIVRAVAEGDPRIRVIPGDLLPAGWLGKNWACHQLSQAATGEVLIFTDADVIWTPRAISRVVGEMQKRHADLQTVWPTQITETWSERLVVPLMAFVIVGYLPLLLVHHSPWPVFAAAMGQCLAFKRDAYRAIGGHQAVRGNVLDDVTLAKRIKAEGLNLRVADGDQVILCRMYRQWTEVRDGFAKNILPGHGNSILFLLLSWLFHWLLWFFPWIWMAFGWLGDRPYWPIWPLSLIILGVGIRGLTAAFSHQRVRDAIWMPVSTLLMAVIALQSIRWHLGFGGPQWRGRSIRPNATQPDDQAN
jgi:chlorobactene glucosyltransferase